MERWHCRTFLPLSFIIRLLLHELVSSEPSWPFLSSISGEEWISSCSAKLRVCIRIGEILVNVRFHSDIIIVITWLRWERFSFLINIGIVLGSFQNKISFQCFIGDRCFFHQVELFFNIFISGDWMLKRWATSNLLRAGVYPPVMRRIGLIAFNKS